MYIRYGMSWPCSQTNFLNGPGNEAMYNCYVCITMVVVEQVFLYTKWPNTVKHKLLDVEHQELTVLIPSWYLISIYINNLY